MKLVKMNKKAFNNGDLESLLKQAGLVKDNNAFPSLCFVSKEDDRALRNNCKKQAKKLRPDMTDKYFAGAIGMYFLNLGPNVVEGKGLLSGYMLVDEVGLKEELKDAKFS